MKKELTLKHGVFLAAAVLLIAGIAFAGAAAAEPVHKTWTQDNLNYMVNTGGEYIIDVDGTEISSLKINSQVEHDLTLNFDYQPYTLNSTNDGGVINSSVSVATGINFTIKNLVLEGGSDIFSGPISGAVINQLSAAKGIVNIENVTVKNVLIKGDGSFSSSTFAGGIIGTTGGKSAFKIINCTVEKCNITATHCGGLFCLTTNSTGNEAAFCIDNCNVLDTCLCGGTESGGLISVYTAFTSGIISNCVVKNCVICSSTGGNRGAGIFVGYAKVTSDTPSSEMVQMCGKVGAPTKYSVTIVGCEGSNNVVVGNGLTGGIIGDLSTSCLGSDVLTIKDNTLSYCTIVDPASSGKAGGFVGKLKEDSVACVSGNTIANCCVVATNGDAAGFCPAVV